MVSDEGTLTVAAALSVRDWRAWSDMDEVVYGWYMGWGGIWGEERDGEERLENRTVFICATGGRVVVM
jgi:hypothetical protein